MPIQPVSPTRPRVDALGVGVIVSIIIREVRP